MPILPEAQLKSTDNSKKGAFKGAYDHRSQPDMLVLQYHEGTDATAETRWSREMQNVLSSDEIHAYAVSRFYLRRMLHVMNPTFFPNCQFASEKSLVVERKSGTPYSWEELPPQTAEQIRKMLEQLGLPLRFFDTSGSRNFFNTPDGFSYVDSVVNTGYFTFLHLLRTEDKRDVLPQDEYLAASHLSILGIAFLHFEHTQHLQEVQPAALDRMTHDGHFTDQEIIRLEKVFSRYKDHISQFPLLKKSEVEKAVAGLIDADQELFLSGVSKLSKEIQDVFTAILMKQKPLLYAKLKLRMMRK